MRGIVRIATAVVLLAGASGFVACEGRTRGRGGGPTADVGELNVVAGVVAGERCAREARCRTILRGGRYPDRAACLSDQLLIHERELNETACAKGVDRARLDPCLQAIRFDDCGAPSPSGAMPECTSNALCKH